MNLQAALVIGNVRTASNGAAQTPYGSGGAWVTPLAGSDGSETFGTGNPYQSAAEAIAHPSPWLYTDSETPVGEHSKSDDYPLEAMEHTLTLTAPYTILPGSLGGVLANLALAGDTVYVATVEWDTKVPAYPLGAATVSNDLVFTTLYTGVLIALDRATGAIVYQRKLSTSANAPISIAGNSVLVPAGEPQRFGPKGGSPQLVVYTVR